MVSAQYGWFHFAVDSLSLLYFLVATEERERESARRRARRQNSMSFLWRWLWGNTASSSFFCDGSGGDRLEENILVSKKNEKSPLTKQQQQQQEEQIWKTAVQHLLQDADISTSTTAELAAAAPTILRHVAQRQRWDCGLACLQMIFHWIDDDNDIDNECGDDSNNNNNRNNSMYEWLVEHVATQSVWTVDLVIVLHELLQLLLSRKRTTCCTTKACRHHKQHPTTCMHKKGTAPANFFYHRQLECQC